jgi:hypothetical protein
MIGSLVAIGLLLLAALIGLTARRGTLSPLVLVTGVLIPPTLILFCVIGASLHDESRDGRVRFGEMRLSVLGLVLPTKRTFSIGGNAETDALVVRGAAPSVVTISGSSALVPLPPRDGPASVISIDGRFPRAVDFPSGSELCLSSDHCYRFQTDGAPRFINAKDKTGQEKPGRAMAQRRVLSLFGGKLAVPAPRPWRPSQAIHPVNLHLPEGAGVETRKYRSVLFQQSEGLLGSQWKLLVLDQGLLVKDASGHKIEEPQERLGIETLSGHSVAIWDVRAYFDPDDVLPTDGQENRLAVPGGRLQERRSFTLVKATDGNLVLTLETPSAQTVGVCARNGSLRPNADISSPLLGGNFGAAFDRLKWPSNEQCSNFQAWDYDLPVGTDGAGKVNVRLERFGAPWLIVGMTILWGAFTLMMQASDMRGSRRGEEASIAGAWRNRPVHWALLCGLQTLLAFRLLISISGSAADPENINAHQLMAEGMMSYVGPSALFLLMAPPAAGRIVWALGYGVFILAVLGGLHIMWGAPPAGLPLLACILVLPAALVVVLIDLRLKGSVAQPAADTGPAESGWTAILAGAAIMRSILGFLSIKERIPGLGVAVSVFYTPALILGFSGLMAKTLREGGQGAFRQGLYFLGWLGLTLGLLPAFVKDYGYGLFAIPIVGMAAWGAVTQKSEGLSWRGRLPWVLPSAILSVLLVGVLTAGAFSHLQPLGSEVEAAAQSATDDDALRILERNASVDGNLARIFHLLNPEWLTMSGSLEAENLRVVSLHLSDYTGSLLGRGYLHDPNLTVLKPVHLNDNVSAVHLMAPFGRVCAAAFLLMLVTLPIACAKLSAVPPGRQREWPEITGFMSLWVLFGTGAYIILANLQLVPFTGRNVYLLAADSDSDLLEGCLLMFMAYLGIAWRLESDVWAETVRRLLGPRAVGTAQ